MHRFEINSQPTDVTVKTIQYIIISIEIKLSFK